VIWGNFRELEVVIKNKRDTRMTVTKRDKTKNVCSEA
jgi:hypothetical protein